MTQQVLDIVTAYQDAWTSGDLDAAATYLAPDFRFESPGASFSSADEFLPFLTRFAGRIGRGWRQVAAFGDGDELLVMYELRGPAGEPLPLTVDHFVVRDGLLAAETLVFDTRRLRAGDGGATADRWRRRVETRDARLSAAAVAIACPAPVLQ